MKPFRQIDCSCQTGINETKQHEFAIFESFKFSQFFRIFSGHRCKRTSEKCEKASGRLQHLLHKKTLNTIWFLFYFCHHCFHVQKQARTWWFFMHSNVWFSDKSRHTVQLNLIKDAAYISISHMLHLSVITNASHNNSNCDAATLKALEMGVL